MDRFTREEDKKIAEARVAHRDAVKKMRQQANSDLVAGHEAEDERVRREHDEQVARGFERDRDFEAAIGELREQGALSPTWRLRAGYYEGRKAAADRVSREDTK